MFMGAKSHRTAGATPKEIEYRRKLRAQQFAEQQQTNSPATPAPVERVKTLAGIGAISFIKGLFK